MSFDLPFELPVGWKAFTVDELVKNKVIAKPLDGNHGGIHPKASDYVESGIPFVMASDLSGGHVDLTACKFITHEQASGLRKGFSKAGDVLLSHKATIGRTAIVQDNDHDYIMLTPQVTYYRVLDESKLSNIYLKSYFDSRFFQNILGLWAGSGSTRAYLGITGQLKLPVIIPPIEIQKEISGQVNALTKKVTVNNQTNQTLELMSQAIFKSWFVDFDPVKAKMNGEQPEGMDAATASLFPEKLVESELGLIPEGWDVGTLDSHTSMIIDHRGKTPKKLGSDWVEEGYPAISAKNIKSKKIVRPDTIRFLDETTYKKWMKEPLVKGDIIMTSEAPMGELYFFDGSQDFCLSQRLYGLRANTDICNPVFLFDWLQTNQAKADMEGRASGSTVLGIKQAELRKVKILTPSKYILDKYSSIVSNLIDMTAKNNAQNINLEKLRDTLLPKLLSGGIDLGETNPESIKEDV